MSELSELDAAVRKMDDLWTICTDPVQKKQILNKRDVLDAQATTLANLTLKDGIAELNDAIVALNDLTQAATEAEDKINKSVDCINKTAETINKASKAATKIAALIAKL